MSIDDPRDLRLWSGTPYHIHESLERVGIDVEVIAPLRDSLRPIFRTVEKVHNFVARTSYHSEREPVIAARCASQVRRRLEKHPVELIFSPGSIPVSLVDTTTPIVVWADATVEGMLDYYPSYSNWSLRTVRNALWLERECFRRVSLFVGSSEWARQSAVRQGLPVSHSHVIPFGANMPPDLAQAAGLPRMRDPSAATRHVLFVGIDAYRKGLETAIDVATQLTRHGIDLVLDVVGCTTSPGIPVPPYVRVHGYLDKGVREQFDRLQSLYKEASLFLLPSKAECCGAVFAEAAAYGLPSVAFDTGGISSMVINGETGLLVPPGDVPGMFGAAKLLLTDANRHEAMSKAARTRFLTRLNWDSAVRELLAAASRSTGVCLE